MVIRQAGEPDWARIWPVWHDVVAAGDTYTYPADATSDEGREIWMTGGETWIADGEPAEPVLGTYHITANQPGAGAHVVNGSYMVAVAARGRGLGRTLVEHSLRRAAELGYRGMQFNAVAATNTGAIALYRRLGFTTIGVVPGGFRHPAEGYVDLHMMYRSLCPG